MQMSILLLYLMFWNHNHVLLQAFISPCQGFSTSALLVLGCQLFVLGEREIQGKCHVHCRVFSIIPGLHPLNTSSTTPFPVRITAISCRFSLWGGKGANLAVEGQRKLWGCCQLSLLGLSVYMAWVSHVQGLSKSHNSLLVLLNHISAEISGDKRRKN